MEVGIVFFILEAALILFISCVVIWIIHRRHKHRFFKRHGIFGPQPELFWGNWKQLKKDSLQVMAEWIRQYGKVFGIYLGDKPCMIIIDNALIKECFIKKAKLFQDRPIYVLNVEPLASSMPLLTGEKWRNVRAVFNACFSAGKVKDLSRTVGSSVDRLIEKLDNDSQAGVPVDVFEASHAVVLDMVARMVLSWQVDCQSNGDEPILEALKVAFKEADNALFHSGLAYPALKFFLSIMYRFSAFYKATQKLTLAALEIINRRKTGNAQPRKDILQNILDAQEGKADLSATTAAHARCIDNRELLSNLVMLIMAGFETPSITLAFLFYVLAKHPEEQEKIRAAIAEKRKEKLQMEETGTRQISSGGTTFDAYRYSSKLHNQDTHKRGYSEDVRAARQPSEYIKELQSKYENRDLDKEQKDSQANEIFASQWSSQLPRVDVELDDDDIMHLEQLDKAVREGMRLYPAISVMIMRKCEEDTTVLGHFIPAGTTVMSPPWHVHRDPEIWPEPERFLPDRFSAEGREIPPSTYYPFGIGPRICVAHRLGMLMMKKTLYRVLERYNLSLDEDVPDPLPICVDNVMLNPGAVVKVCFQRRNNEYTNAT